MGKNEAKETEMSLEWFSRSHAAKLLQSCLILCDPLDSSPSGSSVHRILQARILEWGANGEGNDIYLQFISVIGIIYLQWLLYVEVWMF